MIGAAFVVRGCAEVERRRVSLVGERIDAAHGHVPEQWTDPAVLRDCAYLILMYLPLALLDLLALAFWFASVTLPLWFWTASRSWLSPAPPAWWPQPG